MTKAFSFLLQEYKVEEQKFRSMLLRLIQGKQGVFQLEMHQLLDVIQVDFTTTVSSETHIPHSTESL